MHNLLNWQRLSLENLQQSAQTNSNNVSVTFAAPLQSFFMQAIKLISFQLLIIFTSTACFSQQPGYSAAIEERIKQVERSLGEPVKTDDKPIILQERMKHYGVPGIRRLGKNNKVDSAPKWPKYRGSKGQIKAGNKQAHSSYCL